MYLVVCVLMRITLHGGGLKNGKNRGEPNMFYLIFVMLKKGHVHFGIAPLSFNFFQIFFSILPCLFTVHIRPVLSPCQAGNTCYTLTCFQTYSQLIVR